MEDGSEYGTSTTEFIIDHLDIIATVAILVVVIVLNIVSIFNTILPFNFIIKISLISIAVGLFTTLTHSLIESFESGDIQRSDLESAEERLRSEILSLAEEVEDLDNLEPVFHESKREHWEFGSDLIESADERVAIFEKTPPFFEEEDYNDGMRQGYRKRNEQAQRAALRDAINGNLPFQCAYDLNNYKDGVRDEILKNIKEHHEIANENEHFSLLTWEHDHEPPFYFLVADDRFAIWFEGDESVPSYITFTYRDSQTAGFLCRMMWDICTHHGPDSISGKVQD